MVDGRELRGERAFVRLGYCSHAGSNRTRRRLAVERITLEPVGHALAFGALPVEAVAAAGAQSTSEAPRGVPLAP